MFQIEGELLHKLDQSNEEKNCTIQIGNKQFHYTKVQIALLSSIAFKYFFNHETPFIIEIPSHFNLNDLISCFEQLDSLFHSKNEIIISISNVQIFSFFADFLDNRLLMKKCIRVTPTQTQIFKISTKQLIYLPRSWLNRLNDFNLIINGNSIKISYSLFSCVCEKFQQLNQQENKLVISVPNEAENNFISFFNIMKGYSFCFENIDFSQMKVLIDCFEINILLSFISSKIPFPQTIEESLQFISKSHCEFFKEQFDQNLSLLIQHFN
jgi:hypothetical protein